MVIRVFLISDYQVALFGLTKLLEADTRFKLISSATALDCSVVEAVIAALPDVVLLDMDTNPGEVIQMVSNLHTLAHHAKTLLLSRLDDSALQDRAMAGGAHGIVDKHATPDTILAALSSVSKGQIWLDRAATGRLFVELSRKAKQQAADAAKTKARLTEREQQVVASIADNSGKSGKVIAAKLCISESTLRNHLTAIYEKVGVTNRHGLLAHIHQNGLNKQSL